jgi:hypothetical protein
MPYNPRVLKRLSVTNLILGNYKASQTFLRVLSNNFLSKDFVNHYMPYTLDTNLVNNDKILMEKRSFMPHNDTISGNITDRLVDLIAHNGNNKRAYEHLEMCFLLNHQLGHFISNLEVSRKFYINIPQVYEQAILMYMSISKKMLNYKISNETLNVYKDFIKTFREYKNDKNLAKPMLSNYTNTYLYYVIYNSPIVTGAELKRRSKQVYQ